MLCGCQQVRTHARLISPPAYDCGLRLQDYEDQINALKAQLDESAANITVSIRRAEARMEEEKNAAIAAALKEKVDVSMQLAHKQAIIEDLTHIKK